MPRVKERNWETPWYNEWWAPTDSFKPSTPVADSGAGEISDNAWADYYAALAGNAWIPYMQAGDVYDILNTPGVPGQGRLKEYYANRQDNDPNTPVTSDQWNPYAGGWQNKSKWRDVQTGGGAKGENQFGNAWRVLGGVQDFKEAVKAASGEDLSQNISDWLDAISQTYTNMYGATGGGLNDYRDYINTMGTIGGKSGLLNESFEGTDQAIASALLNKLLPSLLYGSRYTPTYGSSWTPMGMVNGGGNPRY